MAQGQKQPAKAPTQVKVTTGKGEVAKTEPTFTKPPGNAGQPPSAGSTNYVKSGPSVDYNSQQGSRVPADIAAPHEASSSLAGYDNAKLLTTQQQQMQDAGGQ